MNPKPLTQSRTIYSTIALAIVVLLDLWLQLDDETLQRLMHSVEVILGVLVAVFARDAVKTPPPAAAAVVLFAVFFAGCTCPHLESAQRAILTVERDYQGMTPLTVQGPDELRASRLRMLREVASTLEVANGGQ